MKQYFNWTNFCGWEWPAFKLKLYCLMQWFRQASGRCAAKSSVRLFRNSYSISFSLFSISLTSCRTLCLYDGAEQCYTRLTRREENPLLTRNRRRNEMRLNLETKHNQRGGKFFRWAKVTWKLVTFWEVTQAQSHRSMGGSNSQWFQGQVGT